MNLDLSPESLDALARLIAVYSRRAVSRPMSPMEEMSWFESPRYTYFSIKSTDGTKKLVASNARRTAIVIEQTSATGVQITGDPALSPAANPGILVNSSRPVFSVTQHDYGPLVQGDWYANTTNVSSIVVTIIEILLRAWPTEE